jgi:glycerophosphoryl diester phosphodiesterase
MLEWNLLGSEWPMSTRGSGLLCPLWLVSLAWLVAVGGLPAACLQETSPAGGPHRGQPAEEGLAARRRLPLIVAHRGASADAPENTLAAFQLGWDQGADAIEGDFFLTADQQIVALHDPSTRRTGDVDWDVRTKTLAELRTLDVGVWRASRFAGEKIPTLAEVVATIPPGKRLFLEIKDSPRLVPVLKALFQREPGLASLEPSQVVVIAFDAEVIAACKRELPEIAAFWLTGFKADASTGQVQPTVEEILATLQRTAADGLDCQAAAHIDQAFVDKIRAAGYQFHVWTVDDPRIAQRFQGLGVDSITTNLPAAIRQHLDPPPQ